MKSRNYIHRDNRCLVLQVRSNPCLLGFGQYSQLALSSKLFSYTTTKWNTTLNNSVQSFGRLASIVKCKMKPLIGLLFALQLAKGFDYSFMLSKGGVSCMMVNENGVPICLGTKNSDDFDPYKAYKIDALAVSKGYVNKDLSKKDFNPVKRKNSGITNKEIFSGIHGWDAFQIVPYKDKPNSWKIIMRNPDNLKNHSVLSKDPWQGNPNCNVNFRIYGGKVTGCSWSISGGERFSISQDSNYLDIETSSPSSEGDYSKYAIVLKTPKLDQDMKIFEAIAWTTTVLFLPGSISHKEESSPLEVTSEMLPTKPTNTDNKLMLREFIDKRLGLAQTIKKKDLSQEIRKEGFGNNNDVVLSGLPRKQAFEFSEKELKSLKALVKGLTYLVDPGELYKLMGIKNYQNHGGNSSSEKIDGRHKIEFLIDLKKDKKE